MPNRKRAADVVLLASVFISLAISVMAVSKLLNDQSAMLGLNSFSADRAGNVVEQMPSEAQREEQLLKELSPGSGSTEGPSVGPYGGTGVPDDRLLVPSAGQNYLTTGYYSPLYESSPYILPITWGAVAGTLIWRGKVRSQWCRQGYDYDMFKLLARMKGSPIRVALLTSVSNSARTRAQLAEDLDVDWKTIDNHVDVLSKNGLVQEIGAFGTSRYFAITEHGRRVLSLLLSLGNGEYREFQQPDGHETSESTELKNAKWS